jgi:hypothetical protein
MRWPALDAEVSVVASTRLTSVWAHRSLGQPDGVQLLPSILFPSVLPDCRRAACSFRIASCGAGMPDSNSVAGAGITAVDGIVRRCDSRNIQRS